MFLTLTAIGVVALSMLVVARIKRKRDRHELELHSITPEALHLLLTSNQGTLLFDVRQLLDLLGHSAIIPGAKWIPSQELLKNPALRQINFRISRVSLISHRFSNRFPTPSSGHLRLRHSALRQCVKNLVGGSLAYYAI